MATVTRPAPAPPTEPGDGPRLVVAPVRRVSGGLMADLRAIKIVTHRELLRWTKDRGRIFGGLLQPLLLLLVLGTGLQKVIGAGTHGINFRSFLFPGVVAISVLMPAIFSGVSVVWDREFGFLREMLVAPISRSSIILGKCLGGALAATAQSVVVLVLAGLAGVPYRPVFLLELLGMLLLSSFTICAVGLLLAARVRDIQGLMPIIQGTIMPMMFLSGALYPLGGLPLWLQVPTKINPLTYAVQPMRHITFAQLHLSKAGLKALGATGVTWWGWNVPLALELVILAALGVVVITGAIVRFSKVD
jgi:ABC-2 type transport system permease protein